MPRMKHVLIFAVGAWGLTCAVAAPLDFDAAWQSLRVGSDRLAAAHAASDVKTMQRRGLEGLGGPSVALSGAYAAYHAALTVDLSSVNDQLSQLDAHLPIPLENLPIPLPVPQLPPSYTYSHQSTLATASVTAVMPLYVGGANDAVRGLVSAQADEAQADERKTEHELATLLVQRYFGAQLVRQAANLRASALRAITAHDAGAETMLVAGVMSRLERLQVRAALEDARRQAQKASSDAALADQALRRLVHADAVVDPTTPLFVNSQPLPPLDGFVAQALRAHPGLDKVAAKRAQAEHLHEATTALRRPQVFLFGQRDLKTGNQANWVAGVGARWTLFDPLDRRALDAAAQAQIDQAERTGEQARRDIALLVESHWRAAEQARQQVLSMQVSVDLAQELVRLRDIGLREGTSTALDRIDADVNLAKVQTERAKAAFDYVLALASLLEASGQPEALSQHMARADMRIP